MISKLDSKKNFLIYLFLTISSIITPLVVSRQFTSIHDLAYFITNSLRIYNGQTIYKDFVEVHSPGSYTLQLTYLNSLELIIYQLISGCFL